MCEFTTWSPVALGPAPAHTPAPGAGAAYSCGCWAGMWGSKTQKWSFQPVLLCHIWIVIKILANFWEKGLAANREFPTWMCYSKKRKRNEKRFLSLKFPHLPLHAQNVQYCVHSGGVVLEASQEYCRSPLQHSVWFSSVNKNDVVFITIARTGLFFHPSFSRTCVHVALKMQNYSSALLND